MQSTIPLAKGAVKPPQIPTHSTCVACGGTCADWIGQECRACGGVGFVLTYEVGSDTYRTLSGAESVEDLLRLLRIETGRVRDRESVFREVHLHAQADLFAVQASTLQTVAMALQDLLGGPPPEPRGGAAIPAKIRRDNARGRGVLGTIRRLLGAA